jgi:uncharacterized protein
LTLRKIDAPFVVAGITALIAFLTLNFLASSVLALDVPPLAGRVNDRAALLKPETVSRLERQLAELERSDSTQVAVLIVPSLEGDTIEEFGIRVAEAWKIGGKGKDNGVILLVAKTDRKIRIEVGRGLEGTLTDLTSGRIIREEIAPRFKAGDYDAGISAGVAAITKAVRGEYKGTPRDLRHGKKSAPPVITLAIFLGVACVFLGSLSRYLGGAAGAVGLPIIAWLSFPGLALLILVGLGVGGFLLGLLLAALFGGGRGGGGHFGGPFFGGGYFGGGGGGGDGGFSGGGGDFGGGGASDDW